MFKNLLTSLVIHERIETTEAKAKAIKPAADKMVTLAKRHNTDSMYFLQQQLAGEALKKFIDDVAPRFTSRNGGYTRIIKSGHRTKDDARMAIMEWVEKPLPKEVKPKEEKKTTAKTAKPTKTAKKPTKKETTKKEKTK